MNYFVSLLPKSKRVYYENSNVKNVNDNYFGNQWNLYFQANNA